MAAFTVDVEDWYQSCVDLDAPITERVVRNVERVVALLDDKPLDLMIVVGGYNSSNTCNLARICAEKVPTFHIADPACLESADVIRHRRAGAKEEIRTSGWLPRAGPLAVGLTSGASTPDNLVGTTVETLANLCTIDESR